MTQRVVQVYNSS